MNSISVLCCIVVFLLSGYSRGNENLTIPLDISVGAGGSSFQIEGGWNASDKGENIWDKFIHEDESRIRDGSNADVACDSYHKYKEDVKLVKDIGFKHYRFSISWSRILPNGFTNYVSKDGVKYYNDLLDELESNGIVPYLTLYHWDLPEVLERLGGWTNDLIVDWFGDYARVVFREFGSRVKTFATINQPNSICVGGYETGVKAPGKNITGIGQYICGHNTLKAHARAYHIYDKEFRPQQKGKIGIILTCMHYFSKHENDSFAAEVAFQYDCGWFGHPIFSMEGDYPEIMKERIGDNSRLQGWPRSRLPEFSKEWVEYIRGTSDFLGLNHYTSRLAESVPRSNTTIIWQNDIGVEESTDPKWPSSNSTWLKVVPNGFREILRKIKKEYNNPVVYVTENGISDIHNFDDCGRILYLYSYIKAMLTAVREDGCNVKSYTIWSLLDNFEWERGYSERFGLVHVDFKDPKRKRTMKKSALWLKTVLQSGELISVAAQSCAFYEKGN